MAKEQDPVMKSIDTTLEAVGVGVNVLRAFTDPIKDHTGKVIGYYATLEGGKMMQKMARSRKKVAQRLFKKSTPQFLAPGRE